MPATPTNANGETIHTMTDPSLSGKDNIKNRDTAEPATVMKRARDDGTIKYIQLTKYTPDEVAAYVQFKMFKYKRGRQGGRKLEDGTIGDNHPDKTDYFASIVLPLMTPVTQMYQVNWDTFDSPINGQLLASGAGQIIERANPFATVSRTTGALQYIGGLVGSEAGSEYVANVTANTAGAAFNQDSELVLQGTSLRKHAFEFLITPRNAAEKDMIQAAIKLFKIASHPAKMANTTIGENITIGLTYPYEFTIFFMDGRNGREGNPLDIPPIPDCACTNISVTYNPQTARFHEDGSVGQYRLTLQFTEHQTLTRDDIEEGGF